MTSPTCEQIFNDELGLPIKTESDTSWRHGEYRNEVYKRESDDTFWMVTYAVSADGETNELRTGEATIAQCWPRIVETTVYETASPKP